MSNLGKANRAVADVDIRDFATNKPFLYFDTANVTGVSLSSDSVYAMAKGSRRVAFQSPAEGQMTIEAQVIEDFKFYSLFANGVVNTTATYAKKETITCETAGQLTIADAVSGTVFVYPYGSFGDEDSAIAGAYATGTFTATTAGDIAVDSKYEVGYLITKESGVQSVTFNDAGTRDYRIEMTTVEKDTSGLYTPFVITAYKASPQRNLELSFSSEGDPQSITITLEKNSVRAQRCA